jgi:hypothetical protein
MITVQKERARAIEERGEREQERAAQHAPCDDGAVRSRTAAGTVDAAPLARALDDRAREQNRKRRQNGQDVARLLAH